MSRQEIIEFITDLPKNPRDMAERLKKVPLWYTGASIVTVASLVICQLGKRFGQVTPPSEGTTTPPAGMEADINIDEIPIEKESFAGTAISGEVHLGVISQSEIDAVWPKAEKALFAIQSQENILPGTPYELRGLKIIDPEGDEHISLFADVNDGEKVFFYVETDQKGHFTPVNVQDNQAEGRMIRMDVWSDGVSSFLGFESGEEKMPVFELDGSNQVYYLDPFSGVRVEVADNDLSPGMSRALLALVPMPEWTASVPEGFIAVRNNDGTWGIGIKAGDEITPIPSVLGDATGLHLNLEGSTVDIPQDQMAERLKAGQASPLQIYNEAGTAIDYAYDTENKVWIDAAKVLQPDKYNMENFIVANSEEELLELFRLEEMVLLPFPPDTCWPDQIDWDYDQPSDFSISPLGKLLDLCKAPTRLPVNHIVLKAGEGREQNLYIITEQIYNPADGSFSRFHFPFPEVYKEAVTELTKLPGVYFLPSYMLNFTASGKINYQVLTNLWIEAGLYSGQGNEVTGIKNLVEVWLTTGKVPQELEEILLLSLEFYY